MTPWWSGPQLGPLPPVAVWINALGYLTTAVAFVVLMVKVGEMESDVETALTLALGLLVGFMWGVLLPIGLLWLLLWGVVKLARRLR